ncbi:MAG: thrombospondin type 3 repeat-containing protein, partial [Planctomycetota bacterium]
ADGDGVPDTDDNCILVPNGTTIPDAGGNSQLDSNGDGYGNICDADLNDDLVVNGLDVGPFVEQFGTSGPDADLNGDGVVNGLDVGPFVGMFGQAPGPSGQAP